MRAFVAVGLPHDVRAAIAETIEPVHRSGSGVRWVAPDALHVTLQFLGSIEDERLGAVAGAVAAAAATAPAFLMVLRGFGAFPGIRRPRILWVGVSDAPALLALQGEVERALERVGFTPEARPFHPHVTVGRAERGARAADTAASAARLAALEFERTVPVRSVELMQSRLQRGGAEYSVVHSFALAGG